MIKYEICVKKNGPLIACDQDLTISKLGFNTATPPQIRTVTHWKCKTHSKSDQSISTGHKRAPMCS